MSRRREARRHPRRRHRSRGHRRGGEGAGCRDRGQPASASSKTRFSLGAARFLETGDTLTDDDLAAIKAHDAILLGAVGGVPGDPRLAGAQHRARAAAEAAVRARPLREPAADASCTRACRARSPTRATSTSSSCARAPRGRTSATAARSASARRTRSRTRRRVNTAYGVERVVRYAFDLAERAPQEAHARAQDQRARARRAASGSASSTRSAAEHPDVAVDYLHVDAATIFLVTNPC